MKRLLKTVSLLLLIAMIFAMAACGADQSDSGGTSEPSPAPSTAPPSEGTQVVAPATTKDTITIRQQSDPSNLNPYRTASTGTTYVTSNILETLVNYDKDLNIIPCLATSWNFDSDGKGITFELRQGVKFHDGEEMTADDVVVSFAEALANNVMGKSDTVMDLANVKASGTYEVHIPFKKPAYNALQLLTQEKYVVTSKKAIKDETIDKDRNPIGTGPYKFVDWVSGDHISLTRFDDYWGDKAIIKEVVFKVVPENAQAQIELETGNVDCVFNPDLNDIKKISSGGVDGLKTEIYKPSIMYILYFNYSRPWCQDVRIRQAISYAIDKKAIEDAVLQGLTPVVDTTLLPGSDGYYDGFETDPMYPYNVEKAKNLLKEAGYDGSKTLNLVITATGADFAIAAQVIQSQLAAVGIDVEIKKLDGAVWATTIFKGEEHDLTIVRNGSVSGEAYGGLERDLTSYRPDFDLSSATTINDWMTPLLDQALATEDAAARNEIYKQVQIKMMEIAIWVPICVQIEAFNMVDNLQNFTDMYSKLDIAKAYFN